MSQGIRKVSGVSTYQIKRIFSASSIYYVELEHDKEHPLGPYFRDTALEVSLSTQEIIDSIGQEEDIFHSDIPGCTYKAEYEVEKDFDFSQLDGKISFRDGKLVERTRIYSRRKRK